MRLAQLLPVAVLRVPHNDAVHSDRKQHSDQQQHDSRVRPRSAVARRKVVGRADQAQRRKEHKARRAHHRQEGRAHHVRESNHARTRKQHSRHAEVLDVAASHGRVHSRNQANHTQHRQLEHAPVHVAAPHVRQHAAVHPLLRRGAPIPEGVQQALVQRLPQKLPVPREARAHVAGNEVAHTSRKCRTVQHANDSNHAVLHAGAGHRQCEHGAKENAEMHRVRHDVRQAREAHRSPRTRRVHVAPPLESRRHTAVHAPKHSGEQRVAHHHPQRVKGSEHRQEVRQRNGARTLLRRGT
ncbi:dispersed protein family protein 1 (DGF-1) [Trypanosoma cruzi]|uniref:Dispersed protein family protein 1 (DGF-1) n=1 Tax=Trypanosoma cruzi TaxID=5693 RepID=A0A7J6YD32_TRYCR|nr:dispersed protein family protein 1 (DGF-1) [Trypanosoma cruzi]